MKQIEVAAGVIKNIRGKVLISQRPSDKTYPFEWEFPGGKLKIRETPEHALNRELEEELGIKVLKSQKLIEFKHQYNKLLVRLYVYEILDYEGQAEAKEGQNLSWVLPKNLNRKNILPGDKPIIKALNLPDKYMVTPGCKQLNQLKVIIEHAIKMHGISLLQYRDTKVDAETYQANAKALVKFAKEKNIKLLLNCSYAKAQELAASGVHLNAKNLLNLDNVEPDPGFIIGASCHNEEEIDKANSLGVDFAVLSQILPSQSHPGRTAIGWVRFLELIKMANIPVYALGGVGLSHMKKARNFGAQGIAGISCFIS